MSKYSRFIGPGKVHYDSNISLFYTFWSCWKVLQDLPHSLVESSILLH